MNLGEKDKVEVKIGRLKVATKKKGSKSEEKRSIIRKQERRNKEKDNGDSHEHECTRRSR